MNLIFDNHKKMIGLYVQNIELYADLSKSLRWITKLRRDSKFGGAPHKPILLLAVLHQIKSGSQTNNQVRITAGLLSTFKAIWQDLVDTPHDPNFALPFFHMRSEPFWNLITHTGHELPLTKSHSIKSLTGLRESLLYAEIDKIMFSQMANTIAHEIIKENILQQYFPRTGHKYEKVNVEYITNAIRDQVLTEPSKQYQERIKSLRKQLDANVFEEEVFIRSSVFKKQIPTIYNYQCAISGMRVASTNNTQMVDACHIIPFSQSNDDTIGNGISLSPTLHRAFDRGLIGISSNFQVRVSHQLEEASGPYAMRLFESKRIHLPLKRSHYPNPDFLNWHINEVFLK